MALYKVDENAELTKVAGGTLYADLPIGSWVKNDMATIPSGFLKEGDTISQSEYPELYAKYGSTVPYKADKSELSEYENITLSTNSSNPTVMPYDGVYILANYGVSYIHHIYLNGVEISAGITGNNMTGASTSSTILFKKGDTMYRLNTYTESIFLEHVAYYKKSLIVKAKHTPVPADFMDAVDESIIEELHYNNRVNTNVKAFITSSQTHTFTATKTGLLKAYMHKSGSGYTARLFVNGVSVDQLSCFGEDSSGTVLPWIANGGIDATLSTFVKEGDVVKIDSDESGSATTNSWYLYATVLQYKS